MTPTVATTEAIKSRKHGPRVPLNAVLLRRLRRLYKELNGGKKPSSQREMLHYFCEITGLGITSLHEMLYISYQAYGEEDFKTPARRIAELLGESPEDVFGIPNNLEPIYNFDFTSIPMPPNCINLDSQEIVRTALTRLKRQTTGTNMVAVMTKRHGLDGGREHTLEEIGAILRPDKPLTRERVRQIEEKAIIQLRQIIRNLIQDSEEGNEQPPAIMMEAA